MKFWPFTRAQATEARASIENPAVSLSDPEAIRFLLGAAIDDTGQIVSVNTMLGLSAYWAGVNYVSRAVASLPCHVYRRGAKDRTTDDRNPAYRLLHDAPNAETTAFEFRAWLMQQVFTTGRGLAYVERGPAGRPLALWPIETGACVVERLADGRKLYHVTLRSRSITYPATDIIDIPWMLKPDGLSHYDPVQTFRAVLANALGAQDYAKSYFAKGAVPPFVLEGPFQTPGAAQRAQSDLAQALLDQQRGGRTNALALPMGHTLKTLGVAPQQSQLVELRRFFVQEAARFFNLPPVALQDYSDAKYSTAEQSDLAIVKHGIQPWLVQIEQQFNLKLFAAGSKSFAEFNLDGLLRADYKTRTEGMARQVQAGILKPSEARGFENLPYEAEADRLFMQSGTLPVASLAQGSAPPSPPAPEPAA